MRLRRRRRSACKVLSRRRQELGDESDPDECFSSFIPTPDSADGLGNRLAYRAGCGLQACPFRHLRDVPDLVYARLGPAGAIRAPLLLPLRLCCDDGPVLEGDLFRNGSRPSRLAPPRANWNLAVRRVAARQEGGMTDDSQQAEYKIGYKKPPLEHRFSKHNRPPPRGKSKSKKKRSFAQKMEALLEEEQVVTENGKRRKITREEVILRQILANAARGHPKAVATVMNVLKERDAKLPPERRPIEEIRMELQEAESRMVLDAAAWFIGKEVETLAEEKAVTTVFMKMAQMYEQREREKEERS
jgi:Family of unknown function (DUF5681)